MTHPRLFCKTTPITVLASRTEDAAKRLTRIPGIGVLTATALIAAVGNVLRSAGGLRIYLHERTAMS
jgi:transposase